jgi:5-methylcytosine-specific restriction endonuclease McrA
MRDPKPERRRVDADALKRFRLQHLHEPCQVCELRPGVDAHHVTYRSRGGHDIPENLLFVCRPCHEDIHRGVYRYGQ